MDYSLAAGAELDLIDQNWIVRSVAVDNPGPGFVHFPDLGTGAWVAPFTLGAMVSIPAESSRHVRVNSLDVPAGYPASPATTLTATLTAFEDAKVPSPGFTAPLNVNQPWLVPNHLPVTSSKAGAGTQILVPAAAGKTLYLFGWQLVTVTVSAGGAGSLQDSAGNRLGEIRTDTIHETNGQLNGTALGIGLGLNLIVVGASQVDVTVSYSVA